MNIKYLSEYQIHGTYESDIHSIDRSYNAFKTGQCISPALNTEHFLSILQYFNVDLNDKVVLDIGCGHGVVSNVILDKFPTSTVIGVDFSQNRISHCKQLTSLISNDHVQRVHFLAEDIYKYIEDILFVNVTYDVIFAFEVLEHFENQAFVINSIKKLLNKNGIFIGTVPIQPNCSNIQHISPFSTILDVKDKLNVEVYNQIILPLRQIESVTIMYKNK
jgi:2-polyprenyl-3-methyl-5-hydroxy-6-metoxy-1,4-benzoquinol methylase